MSVLFWIYFYQTHINMANDRALDLSELTQVYYQSTGEGRKINDIQVWKKYIKNKGQCFCTTMTVKPLHWHLCWLLSINFNFLSVLLHYVYHQWFWNLYCINNNMTAKYIVLSNIISVVSDSVLRICIQEPLLILKTFIVLLHISSAYNSLLVRYKGYSSDPRKPLFTQAEGIVKSMKTLVLIQHRA